MLNWSGPTGWFWWNQRMIGVGLTGPVTAVVPLVRGVAVVVATSARAATLGWEKTCFVLIFRPSRRARETSWMLRIESPPRAKKSSWTPTRSRPRTSQNTDARTRSVSVLGELRVRGRGELRFGERSAVDLAVDCQGQ